MTPDDKKKSGIGTITTFTGRNARITIAQHIRGVTVALPFQGGAGGR